MVRKTATAIVVLALLLLGLQPLGVPMAGAMVPGMDATQEQPCCPDCDEPARSDQAPCGAMAGCALRCTPAPSSTILTTVAAPDFVPGATASLLLDYLVTAPSGASPPFRPPRLSILA